MTESITFFRLFSNNSKNKAIYNEEICSNVSSKVQTQGQRGKKKESKRELNSRGTKNNIETLSEEFFFFLCCLGEGEKQTSQNKNPADKKSTAAKTNADTHTTTKKKKSREKP